MTWQDPGGRAPEGSGPGNDGPGDRPRLTWTPAAPPPPPAPPATPGPWPAPAPAPGTAPAPAPAPGPGAAPGAGGGWAPPPYTGDGRYAVPGAPGLQYAGALPRFAAFVVDMVLISIAVAIVSAPFTPAVTQVTQGNGFWMSTTGFAVRSGVGSLFGVVVEAAYFTLLWMSSGRATLGMRLFGLQVGRADDGQRLAPQAALVRWLAFGSWLALLGLAPGLAGVGGLAQVVWSIALLVSTIASPTHQGIHDRIAGSAVVRPANAGDGLAIACVVIVLILPLLAIVSLIALLFLGGQVSSVLSNVGSSI